MKVAKPSTARLEVQIDGEKAFLRSTHRQAVVQLPGFDRKKHRVPDHCHASADRWIRQLLEEPVREETQAIYQQAKKILGLVRDQIERSAAEGAGSVETHSFCFSIDAGQDPENPAQARTVRTLRLLSAPALLPKEFDRLFPVSFQEIVTPLTGETNFDDLVRKFENYSRKVGGEVEEEEDHGLIRFLSKEGWEWVVRLKEAQLIIRPSRSTGCLALFLEVAKY